MDEKQLIDDLEKESMLELEVMHESENTDNERIIEDAKSKIEKVFDDLRDLLKDASDPEKVKEALSQARRMQKIFFLQQKIKWLKSVRVNNLNKLFRLVKNFYRAQLDW